MAEADASSDTSSTLSSDPGGLSRLGDVPVVADDIAEHPDEADLDLQGAALRLDAALTLEPDVDLGTQDTDSLGADSTSSNNAKDQPNSGDHHQHGDAGSANGSDDAAVAAGATSATSTRRDSAEAKSHNGSGEAGSERRGSKADSAKSGSSPSASASSKSKKDSGSSKRKNPLKLLKKLTKFDKTPKKDSFSEFEHVRIERLPQVFVAKYLGMRQIQGFCGLHHVRKPVDEMVIKVQRSLEKNKEALELPLVYVVVSPKGLDVREHKLNKQTEGVPIGKVPIDFISYGVQDIKFWRVFTFIVVRELSSRSKVTECHAYLCDSSLNARKMALSLGASFRIHSRDLKKEGKYHNFQVELRPPDELALSFTGEDCDA